jgi:hypothetical protein
MKFVYFTAVLLPSFFALLLIGGGRVTVVSAGDSPREKAGAVESPVDGDELLAAIRTARETADAPSAEVRRVLEQLSNGKPLPPGAIQTVDSLRDNGGEYVYDVSETFLAIPLDSGEELRIPVRTRFLRSRTLLKEIARLEGVLADTPPLPGLYRLKDRVKDLKARVRKHQKQ